MSAIPQHSPLVATQPPARRRNQCCIYFIVFILLLFIVPCVLATTYMVIGHAIMRAAHPSPQSIYRAPLASSAVSGGVGGLIGAPVIILGFTFVAHGKNNNRGIALSVTQQRLMPALLNLGYAIFLIYLFSAGGIAGPFYLSSKKSAGKNATPAQRAAALAAYNEAIAEGKQLSVNAAAAAGFVGGAVLGGAFVLVSVLLAKFARRPVRRPQELINAPFLELSSRAPPYGL